MSYKVVIIDDEPWTRGVIKNLAQWTELDMEVVGEATDGAAGLILIERTHPDIVITDVRMPFMSGLELVERLKEQGNQIPVLIISGYGEFDYVRSALKLGVTDYILKPIKAAELNQQLKRCAESIEKRSTEQAMQVMQAGFFADGWQKIYEEIQEKIIAALQAYNRDKLVEQFERLCSVIYQEEGPKPSNETLIGIYYAIMNALLKILEKLGLTREEVFQGKSTIYVFGSGHTVEQMIHFAMDLYLTAMEALQKRKSKTVYLDIERVCEYLQKNYAQGIGLEQVADEFHVSKEYLSRAFKQYKNEGFTEYVTALRMQRAYELMVEYNVPIKDVGEMVGYCDLANFYKNFKRFYGKTPGEIKKRLKSDNVTSCPEIM